MAEEQLIGMIGSLGFPIVVATYLMVKLDKTLQGMNATMTEFVITNRQMLDKMTGGSDK